MQIPLDRRSPEPLYRQIVGYIERQLAAGNLPAGTVLPPIRTLAHRLGVSKTVVTQAYEELEAAGLVDGRIGLGTVVIASRARPAAAPPPLALPQKEPGAAVLHDLFRLSAERDVINFTTTLPDEASLPIGRFARCLRAVIQEEGGEAFTYGRPEGSDALRQAIARHLVHRGILATPEEILVTNGSQQAIDLVVRGILQPGEWAAVESPCYMGTLDALRVRGARIAPIAVGDEGLRLDELEGLLRRVRPRLVYTNPTFQNPTGTTLPPSQRQQLLQLVSGRGAILFEDGTCSELELTEAAPPALRALNPGPMYCNSFSKTLLPGIRLGYLVAPARVIARLALLKQAADVSAPHLLQRALARFLDQGYYEPHLRRVREVYRERRQVMLEALARHFPRGCRWTSPAGALSIWVTLPANVDASALYVAAAERGVGFAPGSLFFASGRDGSHLRLSYGAEPPDRVEAGIRRLGELIGEFLSRHAPKASASLRAAP